MAVDIYITMNVGGVIVDKGFFGGLFDVNHDGKLDAFERTMDFMAFNEMMNESEDSSEDEDELLDELEMAGLDYDELPFMDENERREVLEDAGLDLDAYDF